MKGTEKLFLNWWNIRLSSVILALWGWQLSKADLFFPGAFVQVLWWFPITGGLSIHSLLLTFPFLHLHPSTPLVCYISILFQQRLLSPFGQSPLKILFKMTQNQLLSMGFMYSSWKIWTPVHLIFTRLVKVQLASNTDLFSLWPMVLATFQWTFPGVRGWIVSPKKICWSPNPQYSKT